MSCAEISAYAFITYIGPSEVTIGARQWVRDEPPFMETTADRVVPLSPPPHNQAGGEVRTDGGEFPGQGGGVELGSSGVGDNVNARVVKRVANNSPQRTIISLKRRKKDVGTVVLLFR